MIEDKMESKIQKEKRRKTMKSGKGKEQKEKKKSLRVSKKSVIWLR